MLATLYWRLKNDNYTDFMKWIFDRMMLVLWSYGRSLEVLSLRTMDRLFIYFFVLVLMSMWQFWRVYLWMGQFLLCLIVARWTGISYKIFGLKGNGLEVTESVSDTWNFLNCIIKELHLLLLVNLSLAIIFYKIIVRL